MFGASSGKRCGSAGHFMTESFKLGLTTLSIGVAGNGRTDPSAS